MDDTIITFIPFTYALVLVLLTKLFERITKAKVYQLRTFPVSSWCLEVRSYKIKKVHCPFTHNTHEMNANFCTLTNNEQIVEPVKKSSNIFTIP